MTNLSVYMLYCKSANMILWSVCDYNSIKLWLVWNSITHYKKYIWNRCAGADVNVAGTGDNVLPIHAASNSSSSRCVKEIITMYPKQLSSKDIKDGGTPLHWAKSREVIELLLQVNTNINAKNFKGKKQKCNRRHTLGTYYGPYPY